MSAWMVMQCMEKWTIFIQSVAWTASHFVRYGPYLWVRFLWKLFIFPYLRWSVHATFRMENAYFPIQRVWNERFLYKVLSFVLDIRFSNCSFSRTTRCHFHGSRGTISIQSIAWTVDQEVILSWYTLLILHKITYCHISPLLFHLIWILCTIYEMC